MSIVLAVILIVLALIVGVVIGVLGTYHPDTGVLYIDPDPDFGGTYVEFFKGKDPMTFKDEQVIKLGVRIANLHSQEKQDI